MTGSFDFAVTPGGVLPVDEVGWYAHTRQLSLEQKGSLHEALMANGEGLHPVRIHLLGADRTMETRAYRGVDFGFPVFVEVGDHGPIDLKLAMFDAREVTWLD